MKKLLTKKTVIKKSMFIMLISLMTLVFILSSNSRAEWKYGIGTGLFLLNIEGDVGVHTNTPSGSVDIPVDLDSSDINDLLETAYGFGGYATDGTWMIRGSFAYMDLEGTSVRALPSGSSLIATLGFTATGAELTVGYPVYSDQAFTVSVDGGLRYTKHELSTAITITGNPSQFRELDNSWIDVLLGSTLSVPLAETWTWNTSANAGFGGSEGTYLGSTGVTWNFYKNWSGTLYYKYTAVEFEEGGRGTPGWYLYDVDESGLGITILYNF